MLYVDTYLPLRRPFLLRKGYLGMGTTLNEKDTVAVTVKIPSRISSRLDKVAAAHNTSKQTVIMIAICDFMNIPYWRISKTFQEDVDKIMFVYGNVIPNDVAEVLAKIKENGILPTKPTDSLFIDGEEYVDLSNLIEEGDLA